MISLIYNTITSQAASAAAVVEVGVGSINYASKRLQKLRRKNELNHDAYQNSRSFFAKLLYHCCMQNDC